MIIWETNRLGDKLTGATTKLGETWKRVGQVGKGMGQAIRRKRQNSEVY